MDKIVMQPPKTNLRYIVCEPEDVGFRADVVAGRRIPLLSRRTARRMALDGDLYINQVRSPPSTRIQLGMVLEFKLHHLPDTPYAELVILHQTKNYLYIDKPPGIHTCRIHPNAPQTLGDLVLKHFPECRQASPNPQDQGAVHRLDALTSGITVFARNRFAWQQARLGFAQQKVTKYYLAISTNTQNLPWPPPFPSQNCSNWLEKSSNNYQEMVIDVLHCLNADPEQKNYNSFSAIDVRAPMGRGAHKHVVSIRADGQSCWSSIQPVVQRSFAGENLLLSIVQLHTGFRHQIRVHLAWIQLPILGDPIYEKINTTNLGICSSVSHRMFLHAWKIDFSKIDCDETSISTIIPKDFISKLINRV